MAHRNSHGRGKRAAEPSTATNVTVPVLSSEELAVWRGFLRWNESVLARVAQRLSAEAGLSRPDYQVLLRLREAGGALSRQALEQDLSWSASRLSHQLQRMEARRLVRRKDAGHGRHVDVELTAAGRALSTAAENVHAAAVRAALLDTLPASVREFLRAQFVAMSIQGRATGAQGDEG